MNSRRAGTMPRLIIRETWLSRNNVVKAIRGIDRPGKNLIWCRYIFPATEMEPGLNPDWPSGRGPSSPIPLGRISTGPNVCSRGFLPSGAFHLYNQSEFSKALPRSYARGLPQQCICISSRPTDPGGAHRPPDNGGWISDRATRRRPARVMRVETELYFSHTLPDESRDCPGAKACRRFSELSPDDVAEALPPAHLRQRRAWSC